MGEQRRISLPSEMQDQLDMHPDKRLLRQLSDMFVNKVLKNEDEIRRAFFEAKDTIEKTPYLFTGLSKQMSAEHIIGSVPVVCDPPFSVELVRKGGTYILQLDRGSIYYRQAYNILYPFESEDTDQVEVSPL